MCENIKEKNTESMECTCKQICCNMQNKSLRCAINGLKVNQYNTKTILKILDSIYNLLTVYSCLPGTCLLKRVRWVYENIASRNGSLYEDERIKVNMLILELETFLGDS